MSKAILVMDMPKNCLKCPIGENMSISIEVCIQCPFGRCAIDNEAETIPDWCPLKPIPEKQKHSCIYNEFQRGAKTGYNACIDEILKGSEENE